MKQKTILLIVLFALGLLFFSSVKAEFKFAISYPLPFENNCPVPGACPSNASTTTSLAYYIVRIYQLAVGLAGVLAVGMIVVGAIYISVSGGSADRRNEGRDIILSAIWGLILLLGSYVILRTINPQLVVLKEPYIEQAPQYAYGFGLAGNTPCPNTQDSFCYFDPTQPTRTRTTDYFGVEDINVQPFLKYYYTERPGFFNGNYKPMIELTGYTAINNVTTPCRDNHCVATSSQVILRSDFPIKDTACLGGFRESAGSFGLCFLEKNTKDALLKFIDGLKARGFTSGNPTDDLSPARWRITEAFPPTSPHHFPGCHYQGTCFDFATQYYGFSAPVGGSNADYEIFCTKLGAVYEVAGNFFNTVSIESNHPLSDALRYCIANRSRIAGIPSEDKISQNENTTGFHVHIQDPK